MVAWKVGQVVVVVVARGGKRKDVVVVVVDEAGKSRDEAVDLELGATTLSLSIGYLNHIGISTIEKQHSFGPTRI